MKKTFLGLAILGFFATNVQAKEVCNTIKECQNLKTKVNERLAELQKDVTPELTEILETNVSWFKAKEICQDEGMRLPTPRELALVSQRLGAQGISETQKDGYELIKAKDSEGNLDYFYFNSKGYNRPATVHGHYFIWSSTVHSIYAYSLDGVYGNIYNSVLNNTLATAVRCVR